MSRILTERAGLARTLKPISLSNIEAAQARIAGLVLRTPLVPLNLEGLQAEVFLKLENLQPTGSFKVRGATNAVELAGIGPGSRGVYTVSAGNMAQALAWVARSKGIPCTVIVPESAPKTKLDAIERFGAQTVKVSWDELWRIVVEHGYEPLKDLTFIHPFASENMIVGNGTIGLEILEDLPNVNTVVVPFGGGGLSTGIACAIKAKKPDTRVYAVEPETAAPLAASFAAGSAQDTDRVSSFVDGIGAQSVLPEMWELVKLVLDGSVVVPIAQIAGAVKLLVERNRIVAEGGGAASVAAVLDGKVKGDRIVCVVSGGNIDSGKLATILGGGVP